MVSRASSRGRSPLRARGPTCAWSSRASGRISSRPTRAPRPVGRGSLRPWRSCWRRRARAFPSYPNSRLVSAVSEVVLALLGRELVEMPTDGLPESLLGAGGGLSEQLFQLCEELLDGVQIRRVGWQIQQARAPLPGSLPSRLSLCGSKD